MLDIHVLNTSCLPTNNGSGRCQKKGLAWLHGLSPPPTVAWASSANLGGIRLKGWTKCPTGTALLPQHCVLIVGVAVKAGLKTQCIHYVVMLLQGRTLDFEIELQVNINAASLCSSSCAKRACVHTSSRDLCRANI